MIQKNLFDPPAKLSRKSDPITSQKSAAETEKKLGPLKEAFLILLRFLKEATANEVATDCVLQCGGIAESYRKRAKDLIRDGLIEECGDRRCEVTGKSATVYKLKERT
jgi:hypothetical protein